jgi:hypothetical protein
VLKLLSSTISAQALEGVRMELIDAAYPLLAGAAPRGVGCMSA